MPLPSSSTPGSHAITRHCVAPMNAPLLPQASSSLIAGVSRVPTPAHVGPSARRRRAPPVDHHDGIAAPKQRLLRANTPAPPVSQSDCRDRISGLLLTLFMGKSPTSSGKVPLVPCARRVGRRSQSSWREGQDGKRWWWMQQPTGLLQQRGCAWKRRPRGGETIAVSQPRALLTQGGKPKEVPFVFRDTGTVDTLERFNP
jgi:hypothetical protein